MLDFLHNKKQREAFARIFAKHYNDEVKAMGLDKSKLITEEDILAVLNDPKREEMFKKAKAYNNTIAQKNKKLGEIRAKYKLPLADQSIARMIANDINLADTPEAEQENIKLIQDAGSLLGKQRLCQKYLRKLSEAKPSEILPEKYDIEHIVEKVAEHDSIYYFGFCMIDVLNNMEMTPEIKEYYDRCAMMIEGYGTIMNGMKYVGNDAFLTLPNKVFDNPDIIAILPTIITPILVDLDKALGIDATKLPEPEFDELSKDKHDLSSFSGQLTSLQFFKPEFEYYRQLIDEGKFTKGAMDSGCFKVDGKICKGKDVEKALGGPNKNKLEFVPYDKKEVQKIDNLIDKGFDKNYQKQKSGIYLYNPVTETEKQKQLFKTIRSQDFLDKFLKQEKAEKKTNFIFSKDTQAYKNMDNALTEFKKHLKNVMKPNDNAKTKAAQKNPKDYPSNAQIVEELKNLTKLVDEYKEHKLDDKRTGKINRNGEKRLEMAIELSDFLHESLTQDKILDAPNGPIIATDEMIDEVDNKVYRENNIVDEKDLEVGSYHPEEQKVEGLWTEMSPEEIDSYEVMES